MHCLYYIIQELQDKRLKLSGDGGCDSPGNCTKYCTYYLMDIYDPVTVYLGRKKIRAEIKVCFGGCLQWWQRCWRDRIVTWGFSLRGCNWGQWFTRGFCWVYWCAVEPALMTTSLYRPPQIPGIKFLIYLIIMASGSKVTKFHCTVHISVLVCG